MSNISSQITAGVALSKFLDHFEIKTAKTRGVLFASINSGLTPPSPGGPGGPAGPGSPGLPSFPFGP